MVKIEDRLKLIGCNNWIIEILSKMREGGLDVNDFYEQQLKYVIKELSEFESERAINRAICMNYVKYELVLERYNINESIENMFKQIECTGGGLTKGELLMWIERLNNVKKDNIMSSEEKMAQAHIRYMFYGLESSDKVNIDRYREILGQIGRW